MAINASDNGTKRELVPAGNYIARCYQMLHIGTVVENIMGEDKRMNKVRIGWELPTELKVFDPAKGEQPLVVSKEFTLSMNEKAILRKMLASWRGKDFSEDECKGFNILKLLGVPCMINVIHKTSKKGSEYEDIASITPMPRGMACPEQITKSVVWDFEEPDYALLESLPDFIKDKIKSSEEYARLNAPNEVSMNGDKNDGNDNPDDLPF